MVINITGGYNAVYKKPKADLMRKYHRYLKIGYVFSLAPTILAFKFALHVVKNTINVNDYKDWIDVEDTYSTVQKPNIHAPPKTPQIIEASLDVPEDIELDNVEMMKMQSLGHLILLLFLLKCLKMNLLISMQLNLGRK